MSYFTQKRVRVPIDADTLDEAQNTITIQALSYGQQRHIKGKGLKVSTDLTGKGGVDVDAYAIEAETFYQSIVDWDGPDFVGEDGQKTPVSRGAIDQLPPWVLDRVKEAINDLDAPLDEAEKN